MSHAPPPPSPQLPPALRDRVLAAVQEEPAETQGSWLKRRTIILVLSSLGAVALFFAMGGLKVADRDFRYLSVLSLAWALVTVMCTYVVVRRGGSSVGVERNVVGLVFASPLALVLVVLFAGQLDPNPGLVPRKDLSCLILSMVFAGLPAVGTIMAHRGAVFIRRRWFAAAVASSAAVFGCFLMMLKCPCHEIGHLLIGHVLPVVIFAGIGWALGVAALSLGKKKSGSG
jgi:Negative regulator of sigma F